ncbi:hypothetical protein CAL7716_105540 (plasmid) [Calothrix sp. PCC 7716]|nr:hypothetical protein CAL7716_105540 [Calothrix sp. PCC 7716]
MELTTLITALMAVITPFVKKGAEEFAGAAGHNAYDKAKAIFSRLRDRWSNEGDQEASDILKKFEEKPERYEAILKDILSEKLAQDKELFEQLSTLLKSDNTPNLNIAQNLEEGEDVTGVKANRMNKGTANINQDIKQGKKITGADIDSIG